MHSLQLDSEEITASLERIMQQPYIEKYIEKPFIDRDKMIFLTDICRQINLSPGEREQLILPVMLVQCALDTHEEIPSGDEPEMNETEKQLSVLAGDYYSGLYYALLAGNGHIQMIRVLASAIKEINEYKMNLYYKKSADLAELIYFLTKIESSLITYVAGAFHLDQVYIEVVEKVCLINRLKREVLKDEKGEPAYIAAFLGKWYGDQEHVQPVQYIEKEIEKQMDELDQLLSHLSPSYDGIRQSMKDRFSLVYHTTYVEEG